MRDRHVFIDLYDNFLRALDDAPHVSDLRSQIEIAMAVHRSHLKHRDVDFIIVVYPEKRQFTEQHRDIPASSVFIHLSVMYIKVRRSKTDLLVACSRQISLKRFLADAYRTDDRDVA